MSVRQTTYERATRGYDEEHELELGEEPNPQKRAITALARQRGGRK